MEKFILYAKITVSKKKQLYKRTAKIAQFHMSRGEAKTFLWSRQDLAVTAEINIVRSNCCEM